MFQAASPITPGELIHYKEIAAKYEESHTGQSYTPNKLFECESLSTSSTITDFNDAVEVIEWYYDLYKPYYGSMTTQLSIDARTSISDIRILLRRGDYTSKIKNALLNGTNIETIKFYKISNEGETNKKSEEVEFTNNTIIFTTRLSDKYDLVIFKTTAYQETIFKRDQAEGEAGQMVSGFDCTTASLKGGE
ncbi:MAG: hypothetical protein HYS39_01000 [Proteobacteria bacterium]|nr:hypothetical protein [Pseudomonadota bacterium]